MRRWTEASLRVSTHQGILEGGTLRRAQHDIQLRATIYRAEYLPETPGTRERQRRVPRLEHEERMTDARYGLRERIFEPARVKKQGLVLAAHEDI